MQCPEPTELTRAHLLRADDGIAAHVAGCARCGAEWSELELVSGLARELAWERPARDQIDDVRARIVASVTPHLAIRRRTPIVVGVGVALAAAAAIALWIVRDDVPATPSYAGAVRPLPRADFALAAARPDEQVRLWNGTIAVEVAELAPGERFRVITGDAEVEVRGTGFEVIAANDHLVGVRVAHGRVEIRAQGGAPVTLGAGERWEATLELAPPPVPAPAPAPDPDPAPAVPAVPAPETPSTAEPAPHDRPSGRARHESAAPIEPAPTPATPTPTPTPVPPTPVPTTTGAPAAAAIKANPTPATPAAPVVPAPTPTTTPTRPTDPDDADRRQERREQNREDRRDDRRDRRNERRQDRRDDRRNR